MEAYDTRVHRSSGSTNSFSLEDFQKKRFSKAEGSTDSITSVEEGCCLWGVVKTIAWVVSAPFRWIGSFFYNLCCGDKGNEEKSRISGGANRESVHNQKSRVDGEERVSENHHVDEEGEIEEEEGVSKKDSASVHDEKSEEGRVSGGANRESVHDKESGIEGEEGFFKEDSAPVHDEESEEGRVSQKESKAEENPITPLEINYQVIKDEVQKRRFSAFWIKETPPVEAGRPNSFIVNSKLEHHLADSPPAQAPSERLRVEDVNDERKSSSAEGGAAEPVSLPQIISSDEQAPSQDRLSQLISSRDSGVDSEEDEVQPPAPEQDLMEAFLDSAPIKVFRSFFF